MKITKEYIENNLLTKNKGLNVQKLKKHNIQISNEELYCIYKGLDYDKEKNNNKQIFKGFTKEYIVNHKNMEVSKEYIDKYVIKSNNSLNSNIMRQLKENSEELYLIYHNTVPPKCICNKKLNFVSFGYGYSHFCDDCARKNPERYKKSQETLKKTNLKRYGVECTFSLKESREKAKLTKIEKYNDENYNNSKSISETLKNKTDEEKLVAHKKSRRTRLEKYGDENYNNMSKIKQTKLEKYGDENYNNSDVAQPKRRKTMEEKGLWIPEDEISAWNKYKYKVQMLTEKTYKEYKDEINPNDYDRVLCGRDGYQLDHIISVYKGFSDDINPNIIAGKDNLQMLPWKDNRNKWF